MSMMLVPLLIAWTIQTGVASVYTDHRVACPGQRYSAGAMRAAHRSLPCGAWVKVTNLRNGRTVRVRINDRGPFVRGRIIDLTPAAARMIALDGLAPVQIERVRS